MSVRSFSLATLNPELACDFYTAILGLKVEATTQQREGDKTVDCYLLSGIAPGVQLILRHAKGVAAEAPYSLKPNDNYWKFSLFVDDIERVAKKLRQHDVEVSDPVQFGEVGYLAHFNDRENYAIELIERRFKPNHQPVAEQPKHPLGEQPQLGLLTLRTADPVCSVRFYEQVCGLKLLVRMYVERAGGFTLYFLGSRDLVPPSADIDAVINREWLYQQPELFIELQHYWGSEWSKDFRLGTNESSPWGLGDIQVTKPGSGNAQRTRSPDGHIIHLE